MKNIFSLTPSFGGVNADLIIRNMIFCVLYVCAILIVFSYILWPMILGFKSQYINERKEKIIYTEIKKDYDDNVKALNNLKKKIEKMPLENASDEKKDRAQMALYLVKELTSITLTVYGAQIQAAKDLNAQARALCAKAMVKSKTLTRESATIEHPAYEGFFDGFDMI